MLLIIKLCCSRHQRSKILKANHNDKLNSTKRLLLFTTSKIENFESKSQLVCCLFQCNKGCSRHQRSKILKANHNAADAAKISRIVVHDIKDRKF